MRRVDRRARPPRAPRGLSDIVAIITVNNAGQLVGVSIRQSSGNAEYDQAVRNAIIAVAPFPAAPAELPASSYPFSLIIEPRR
ncbi:MAG: TonB family protein [Pseudomonadota bacterium]